jgi:uncharacterized protein (DUF58 family)
MIVASRRKFLDLRALSALEHLRFTTRQRIEGTYSGRHSSRRQGGAGEFADFREYSSGDDLRSLDWKVLARTGRTYLRLFQDETNLVCTLAIDASRSMEFAGQSGASKLAHVQHLASALGYMIGRQQDQVGLAVIADGMETFLPPASTPSHLAAVYDTIEGIATRPVTKLADGLRTLFQRSSRRGVLMLMSDFLVDDLEQVVAAVRLFRHRQYEVVLMHVIHPEEERLPDGAAFRFEGLENDGWVDGSPAEIRQIYEERFAAHVAMVRTLALAAGCDYRRVFTGTPYLRTVGSFLVERTG